jgi:hypothetical protein
MSAHRAKKLVEAGVWLRISGDHEGARRLFEQALVLDPTNVRAKQLLEAPPSTPLAQQAVDHTAADETAAARNPFLRGEGPSRSVGLDVDWGLAAILPESQSVFRPRQQVDETSDVPSAWDPGSTPPTGASRAQVGPGSAPAMEMVSTAARSQPTFPTSDPSHPVEVRDTEVQTLLQGAQDLIGLDDHSGAMDLLLRAQRLAPDRPDVRRLRERTEAKLLGMPRVLLKQDEIIWLNLDHRAGFVLAQIDGTLSLEDLFAVSGMSRLDTARILVHLKEQGVISLS